MQLVANNLHCLLMCALNDYEFDYIQCCMCLYTIILCIDGIAVYRY